MSRWVLVVATVGLFLIWSNSFVAMSYLLGAERSPRRLDWVELTVARFVFAGVACGLYLASFQRREALRLARAHPVRLVVCALLVVPVYNLALYYAQQHGIPPAIASLTTALVPLFVLVLSRVFLGEAWTAGKLVGLTVSSAGMLLVASARGGLDSTYPSLVLLAVTAPACWSVYSVLSKPVAATSSPLVWSYSALTLGGLFVLPGLASSGASIAALDGAGWAALAYLALPCAVLGNAVWTWLLRHLPAGTVGFTVFLNPPLTTASKWLLALGLPGVFEFTLRPLEFAGAIIVLCGLWIAIRRPRAGS